MRFRIFINVEQDFKARTRYSVPVVVPMTSVPVGLTNKRLPKEAKDYEIRSEDRNGRLRLSAGDGEEPVAHRCSRHAVVLQPPDVFPRPRDSCLGNYWPCDRARTSL